MPWLKLTICQSTVLAVLLGAVLPSAAGELIYFTSPKNLFEKSFGCI
jgi:hypothetical protein